jgi:hypothetical protein
MFLEDHSKSGPGQPQSRWLEKSGFRLMFWRGFTIDLPLQKFSTHPDFAAALKSSLTLVAINIVLFAIPVLLAVQKNELSTHLRGARAIFGICWVLETGCSRLGARDWVLETGCSRLIDLSDLHESGFLPQFLLLKNLALPGSRFCFQRKKSTLTECLLTLESA